MKFKLKYAIFIECAGCGDVHGYYFHDRDSFFQGVCRFTGEKVFSSLEHAEYVYNDAMEEADKIIAFTKLEKPFDYTIH